MCSGCVGCNGIFLRGIEEIEEEEKFLEQVENEFWKNE